MVSPSDMTDAVRGGSQHDRCEELRQEGNEYFKEKRFESAIDKYSQALAIATALEFGAYSGESGVAKLYANRAAASAALGDWEAVERDADKSIETDPKYVLRFCVGVALIKQELTTKCFVRLIDSLFRVSIHEFEFVLNFDVCFSFTI